MSASADRFYNPRQSISRVRSVKARRRGFVSSAVHWWLSFRFPLVIQLFLRLLQLSDKQEFQRLLFPAAGGRNYNDGYANGRGNYGCYWSSRPNSYYAYNLNFNSSNTKKNNNNRANGYSVRCVQITD